MAPQTFCVGTQNFKFVYTKMCGCSKFVGTCTQNLNCMGTHMCEYSKLGGCSIFIFTQNLRDKDLWVLKNNRRYSNLLVFILKILLILKIWGTIICGYSKFVGAQNL